MEKRAGGTDGVRRWQEWLEEWFTGSRLARIGEAEEGDVGAGAVAWSVEIRHGKHGRVYVTARALGLDEERFGDVVRMLERDDWYSRLEEALRVRIDDHGRVERVD